MTRREIDPTDGARVALAEARADIARDSVPIAGLYRMKMITDGPWVPVRIWQGFGLDPETGEPREVCWMWRAERRGREVPIDRCWPWCAGEPIKRSEYEFLLARIRYAMRYATHMPDASPREAVDYSTLRFNFGDR